MSVLPDQNFHPDSGVISLHTPVCCTRFHSYGDDKKYTTYGRYRDTVNDYYTKLDHYTNRYLDERNFDYTQSRDQVSDWQNNRDYYYQKLQNELDYALRKDELEWKKSKE